MPTYDEIVELLARAGMPYVSFDSDSPIDSSKEYADRISDLLSRSGMSVYEYAQILSSMVSQLYHALKNTVDAYDDYRYMNDDYSGYSVMPEADLGGVLQ